MAFTVEDYQDLVRLLKEKPEWQSELRRLILSEDWVSLPETLREIATIQQRTDRRIEALTAAHQRAEERLSGIEGRLSLIGKAVQDLAAAHQRAEERLDRAEQRLDSVEERLAGVEERLAGVEERLDRLELIVQSLAEQVKTLTQNVNALTKTVEALTETVGKLNDTVGGLKGDMLELTYRNRAGAYFGPLLRRLRVVEPHTLEDTLEAALTPGEFRDFLRLDLLVSGMLRQQPESPEIWLAIEISHVVDQSDVDRAERRASLLRKAKYHAVPTVAGAETTRGAEEAARLQNVVLVQDGRTDFWDEALSAWLSAESSVN